MPRSSFSSSSSRCMEYGLEYIFFLFSHPAGACTQVFCFFPIRAVHACWWYPILPPPVLFFFGVHACEAGVHPIWSVSMHARPKLHWMLAHGRAGRCLRGFLSFSLQRRILSPTPVHACEEKTQMAATCSREYKIFLPIHIRTYPASANI